MTARARVRERQRVTQGNDDGRMGRLSALRPKDYRHITFKTDASLVFFSSLSLSIYVCVHLCHSFSLSCLIILNISAFHIICNLQGWLDYFFPSF